MNRKMVQSTEIAILMATYNGEQYLSEQIDSLFAQTYQNWHLYVHDDGSKDGTLSIVKKYIREHPEKITLLDYPPQGGPCPNFLSMLERVEASYYMFCDQDDVWLPEKVSQSLEAMTYEESVNPQRGVIVFTDLNIVNEHLDVISISMWKYSGLYPQYIRTFSDAGGHTVLATGCTMLFNHQAKKNCLRFEGSKAVMHDIWLCLCTLSQGGILHGLNKPLVLYRQHGNNFFGSGNINASSVNLGYRLLNIKKIVKSNQQYYFMLSELGYGSVLKYIMNKIRYNIRIRRKHY